MIVRLDTNDTAEYWGMVYRLRRAAADDCHSPHVIGDSAMIIRQHNYTAQIAKTFIVKTALLLLKVRFIEILLEITNVQVKTALLHRSLLRRRLWHPELDASLPGV